MPTPSAEVDREAAPPDNDTVLSGVAPSKKVTLPVGVPAVALTLALKVTDCPNTDGFSVEFTDVEVLACPTDWLRAPETLVAWLASPP